MGETTIEMRLAVLETELQALQERLAASGSAQKPWWLARLGAFEGDEAYEQAACLATAHRNAEPRASDGRLHPGH